jgi:hypothetical protein
MIKVKTTRQVIVLAEELERVALDIERTEDEGSVQVGQANDGVIGVSRMTKSNKIRSHTYIMEDGDTREVTLGAEEEQ